MRDYIKPAMRHDPYLTLLNAGTDNLISAQIPIDMANDIIDIAFSIKTKDSEVVVSSMISRGHALNNKANEVSKLLAEE